MYETYHNIYTVHLVSCGAKGGIYGAIAEPAEFAGRYAWEYYGGTEKTRALAWYYQRDLKQKYKNWTAYNYGRDAFQKKIQKKNDYESTYSVLQAPSSYRRQLRGRKRKSYTRQRA